MKERKIVTFQFVTFYAQKHWLICAVFATEDENKSTRQPQGADRGEKFLLFQLGNHAILAPASPE
jgi:hypothetical protein